MRFIEQNLPGLYVIRLDRHEDDRGFFARTYCAREFREHGLPTRFPQCNLSRNTCRGTLRGMHYQAGHHREAKLVRCVRGAIFDVVIDIRAGSPTRTRWLGVTLTAGGGEALYIPAGFAHGFLTLQDDTDVFYQMGEFHAPEAARGIRWNDPAFGIDWPEGPQRISERDRTYPDVDPATVDG